MSKQGVNPDELSQPFWDGANDNKLMIQNCITCNKLQHPPEAECRDCENGELEWKEMSGKGKIYNYVVVYDCPVRTLQEDQPFNVAVVMLDEVPVGADVEVIFEKLPNGQHVPEWKLTN